MSDLAAVLHDQWRATRRRPDGSYVPRWKDGHALDIANTAFTDQPVRWQGENLAAARSALAAVVGATGLEGAAEVVHADWVDRNVQWAPADQVVPYRELTEVEKDKDRLVVRAACEIAGVHLTTERGPGRA